MPVGLDFFLKSISVIIICPVLDKSAVHLIIWHLHTEVWEIQRNIGKLRSSPGNHIYWWSRRRRRQQLEKTHPYISWLLSWSQLNIRIREIQFNICANSASSLEGRWGCLATGQRWDFYFLRKRTTTDSAGNLDIIGFDLFETTDIMAVGQDGAAKVMGTWHNGLS